MKYKENELKQGIKIHTINTNKFKTNLLAVFLTTELNRKTVTKNALISMLLRRCDKYIFLMSYDRVDRIDFES